MARLASKEKILYYPTPESVFPLIGSYLEPSAERGLLLDPCCGKGTAAKWFGDYLNCDTWGSEISPFRAEEATKVMDKVIEAAWSQTFLTSECISVLLLNPPYDWAPDGKRYEWIFFHTSFKKLITGGILIYIVPKSALAISEVAKLLDLYFEDIHINKFPDEEYQAFKQVVVMARRRKIHKLTPDPEKMKEIMEYGTMVNPVPELEELGLPVYQILPRPKRGSNGNIRFRSMVLNAEEIVDSTVTRGVHLLQRWKDTTIRKPKYEFTDTLMPLKTGHVAMSMSTGVMGTVRLQDLETNEPLLARGRIIKVWKVTDEKDSDDGSEVITTKIQKPQSIISMTRNNGIVQLQTMEQVTDFMKKYSDQLIERITQTTTPLYNFDMTERENKELSSLGLTGKLLPGMKNRGLLATQKHIAAALYRGLQKYNVSIMQGEMGVGKTRISIGVAHLLDANPFVVLCPPTLLDKWKQEIEEVIPDAVVRIIGKIGKNADDPCDDNDIRKFIVDFYTAQLQAMASNTKMPIWGAIMASSTAKMSSGWDPVIFQRDIYHPETRELTKAYCCSVCGEPLMVKDPNDKEFTLPITELKEFVKYTRKNRFCTNQVPGWQLDGKGRRVKKDGEHVWKKRPCGGSLVEYAKDRRWMVTEYVKEHAKYFFKLLIADECFVKNTIISTINGSKYIQDIKEGDYVLSNNSCNNVLEHKKVLSTMKNPAPQKLINFAGLTCTRNHPIFTEENEYVPAEKISGKTLRVLRKEFYDSIQGENNSKVLLPITSSESFRVDSVEILEQGCGSEYERLCPDNYVYNFEVEGNNNYFANGVLVHNCHQYKGESTDRATSFHHLSRASERTLAMTGTFFGGKSSSIFWLLYRMMANIRDDFGFTEEERWAAQYGILQSRTRKKSNSRYGDDYGYTGNKRKKDEITEKPGITPSIIGRLLHCTAFISLKDLGLELPPYNEEVAKIDMEESQKKQYSLMHETLKSEATGDKRKLSMYLQWSLGRPNSGFRDEVINFDIRDTDGKVIGNEEIMRLPKIVTLPRCLPKEVWLANYILEQKALKRPVLTYVRQTDTRDIRPHLVEILSSAGVRSVVLSASVSTRKRMQWITDKAVGNDTLICNPRLVETGLDLVMFPNVVFFEIEYSLYTLWQAVRRVWRLGQTLPVKATFAIYPDTMEAIALALMGQKMKAAQTLYGDEVGGAIIEEEDDDLLTMLAREILKEKDIPDLQSLFAENTEVSHSSLGNLILPSANIIIPTKVATIPTAVSWDKWLETQGQDELDKLRSAINKKKGRRITVDDNQQSLF